jgi:hypothetical protein
MQNSSTPLLVNILLVFKASGVDVEQKLFDQLGARFCSRWSAKEEPFKTEN